MNMNASPRKLTTLTLVGVVGLALAAAPALAQQTGEEVSRAQEQPREIQVKILGISCPFCAYGAEQKLRKLDGVRELSIDLESGLATLSMEAGADVPNEKLKKTVDSAGFEAAAIVRNFESDHEDWHPEKMPTAETGSGSSRGGAGDGAPSG